MNRVVVAAICMAPGIALAAPGERVLHSFGGPGDGTYPQGGGLVSDAAGIFYGNTTSGGAHGLGIVFSIAPPKPGATKWSYTVLHDFAAGEGNTPAGSMLPDSIGALTGVTIAGGTSGQGTVFRLSPPVAPGDTWTLQTLWNFSGGADGAQPYDGVVAGPSGILYGTTYEGGGSGHGVAYALTPPAVAGDPWTLSILHDFQGSKGGAKDGSNPISALRLAKDGALYGATQSGGLPGEAAGCSFSDGCGTIFRLRFAGGAWHETILHVFGKTSEDGASPESVITIGADGTLYGSTAYGGGDSFHFANRGVVYALSPPAGGSGPWTYTVLKEMAQSPDYLSYPVGDLAQDASGALYGAALDGGPDGPSGDSTSGGGIFKLTPPAAAGDAWTYSALHTFTAGSTDFCKTGCYIYTGPGLTSKGAVIGATYEGGTFRMPPSKVGAGVIFLLKQP